MALIAMLIAIGGYGLAYEGICLVKGKDVSFAQMFSPLGHYPALAGPFSSWPAAPPSVVFPSGTAAKAGRRKQGAAQAAPASKAA